MSTPRLPSLISFEPIGGFRRRIHVVTVPECIHGEGAAEDMITEKAVDLTTRQRGIQSDEKVADEYGQ